MSASCASLFLRFLFLFPCPSPTPAVTELSPAPLAQTGVVPILPINSWAKTGATTPAGGIEASTCPCPSPCPCLYKRAARALSRPCTIPSLPLDLSSGLPEELSSPSSVSTEVAAVGLQTRMRVEMLRCSTKPSGKPPATLLYLTVQPEHQVVV